MLAWVVTAVIAGALGAAAFSYHARVRRRWVSELARAIEEAQSLREVVAGVAGSVSESARHRAWLDSVVAESARAVLVYEIADGRKPGRFIAATDAACRLLEFSRDELLRMTPFDVEAPDTGAPPEMNPQSRDDTKLNWANAARSLAREDDRPHRHIRERTQRVLRDGGATCDMVCLARSGQRIAVSGRLWRVDGGGAPLVVCRLTRPDTEDAAARRIAELERRHRDLFDHAAIGLACCGADGAIADANPAFLKIFGLPSQAQCKGLHLFDGAWLPDRVRAQIRRGHACCEVAVDFDELARAGAPGTQRQGKAHLDVNISNLGVDARGVARGYLLQVRDATDAHDMERVLEASERQSRRARNLEAVGTLAAGTAHDFNNILMPILGYAEMGLDLCPPGQRLHEFLSEIRGAAYRAKELVGQILTFSRADAAGRPVHAVPIVKEAVKQIAATAPPNVRTACVVETRSDLVVATPAQVHQLVLNLCANAVRAMRAAGGDLEVRLTGPELDDRHGGELSPLFADMPSGADGARRCLRLSVRDTGDGMDKDTMARVFEPFFTTRAPGEGTGMGLTVVKGIATAVGGTISVDSEVGRGTTFHVVLPLADPEPATEPSASASPAPGNCCVLFVDDDAAISRMAAMLLTALGYEPVVTADPRQALEMVRADPTRFDAVITDQVMPEMTGMDFARRVTALRPGLPVLIFSGCGECASPEEAGAAGVVGFIAKPVDRNRFAQTLAGAIAGSAARRVAEAAAAPAAMGG